MRRFYTALPLFALLAGCMTPPSGTPPGLGGTEWRFTTIDGAPPAAEASLAFETDRLIAHTGCNRMAGAWRSADGKLIAGPLAATKMFCEGRMHQETVLGELLGGSPALTVSGDRLTLRTTAHWAELERKK
jgi:heat shock protein HslJ